MPFQSSQDIFAGSALILIGDVFTPAATTITTTTTGAALITDTQIDVTAPATIAPNVAAEGSEADPCVIDVIGNVAKNEIVLCYSTNTTTGNSYINVSRGWSKWWSAQNPNDTTFAAAWDIGDELQFLGTGSFPDWSSDFVFTNDAVSIAVSQDTFMARNNQRGNVQGYSGGPAMAEVTMTLPNNTVAAFVRQIGKQAVSDSKATPSYKQVLGGMAAGVQLIKKFLVVIPNEQYYGTETATATMGGATKTYKALNRAYIIPVACLNPAETVEFTEGAQKQIPVTFTTLSDNVHCTQLFGGAFPDEYKLFKSIG